MLKTKVGRFLFAPDAGADGGGEATGVQSDSASTGETEKEGGSLADIMEGSQGAEPSTQTDTKGADGKGAGANEADIPAWMKQLTEDMRGDSELLKFRSLKDFVGAYKELAKGAGGGFSLPAEDAKPEEVQAFYEKLGKPKTADAYTLEAPDGVDTSAFRKIAFDAHLTDAQAQKVYSLIEQTGKSVIEARKADLARKYKETESALKKEYGAKYPEKQALLKRGLTTFCSPTLTKKLVSSGLTADEDVVHLFIRLGEMNAEAGTVARGADGSAYKSVSEGGMIQFEHLDQLQ